MRQRAEYMRAYRLKNREKCREAERLRYAMRKFRKDRPNLFKAEVVSIKRCRAKDCKYGQNVKTYLSNGFKVDLCEAHKNVDIFA